MAQRRRKEAEQHQAEGLAEEQARWVARRELGNLTLLQEDTRAMWGWTILEQIGQDPALRQCQLVL